ncbi:MAG: leucine-rich repeat domain-containing protein [Clostridia bacterium]|nr:leucine-rich repeat domain-containing protein [Clostridia bacterium]
MLKKCFLVLMALLMILTLAACDKQDPDAVEDPDTTNNGGDSQTGGDNNTTPQQNTSLYNSGTLEDSAITWEMYEDGRLIIKGTGEMTVLDRPNDYPWYPFGGSTSSERSDADGGVPLATSIIIEAGVTSVADKAFFECKLLKTVTLASTVTSLGYQSFAYCANLQTVSGTGLTTIGDQAFRYCTSLEKVTLSSALTTVGMSAFDNLRLGSNTNQKLAIRFKGTQAQLSAVTIDSGNAYFKEATVEYVSE